jgi:hypothetical protein
MEAVAMDTAPVGVIEHHGMSVAEPPPAMPQPKLRWYQYRLRTLLVLTTLAAVVLSAWRWWDGTREQRRLRAYIWSCTYLTERERELFCGWVDNKPLLEHLDMPLPPGRDSLPWGRVSVHRLVWQSDFVNVEGRKRHVFLFRRIWHEAVSIVVLCDGRDRALTWNDVGMHGLYRSGWVRACHGEAELMIDADTLGFHNFGKGRGLYRFALHDSKITSLPTVWEPAEILLTHRAMASAKHRVTMWVRTGDRLSDALHELSSGKSEYMESNIDGWGRRLHFRMDGERAIVTSYGRDGKPGGTGDDEDIVGEFDPKRSRQADAEDQSDWIRDSAESWVQRFR